MCPTAARQTIIFQAQQVFSPSLGDYFNAAEHGAEFSAHSAGQQDKGWSTNFLFGRE